MKKNSVIVRIFIFMTVLAVIISVVASFYVKTQVEKDIAVHMEDEVNIIVDALNFAITPLIENDNAEAIENLIENFKKYEIIKLIRVHDIDGTIMYSNDPEEVGKVSMPAMIGKVAENPELNITSIQMDDNIMNLMVPLICGHGNGSKKHADAVLCIEMDFKYPESIGKTIVNDLSIVLIFVTVIFLAVLFVFIERILGHPMNKLTEAATEISKNNYKHRIEITSQSELKDLAIAFNKMAGNIELNSIQLAEAKEVAEQASEARLNFLAKMSHEIRTPLNAIIGFTDILSEEIVEPHHKESMDIVLNSSKHLLNLVNEILEISKLENDQVVLESQPLSLRTIVADVSNMFYLATTEKNVELSFEIDTEVPIMYVGDAHRIRQILINLIGNAVKFTNSGTIETLVKYEKPFTVIEVVDSGIGIPQDQLDGVFEAYAQSDASISKNFGGTGLGLSISKRIANMMGGDILLKSEVGKGSTFSIQLKLEQVLLKNITGSQMVERWLYADSTVEDIARDVLVSLPERVSVIEDYAQKHNREKLEFYVHSLKGVTGNFNIVEIYEIAQSFEVYLNGDDIRYSDIEDYIYKINEIVIKIPKGIVVPEIDIDRSLEVGEFKILLAEDVKANRLLIKEILRNYPVEIDFACNGVEAIDMLQKQAYDCLLLDIQMPILTGEDVLKWIRQSGSYEKMHIVALTANAFKEDMEKYLGLGAHWFLSKPVKKELLRDKVSDLMQLKANAKLMDE